MEKTSIRKLLETAVQGLQKEYLSEEDRKKMVDYLLSWSTLSVSNRDLLIASASMLGIGKEQADVEIKAFPFISFFWGGYDVENKIYEEMGLPSRTWMLKNYRDLAALEAFLTMDTDTLYDIPEGEVVVLINGKVQNYKVSEIEDPIGMGLKRSYVEWETLEPYQIEYSDNEGVISLTEYCNSRIMTEFRVLQILKDGATKLEIKDILSDKVLHFAITEIVVDSSKPSLAKTRQFQWKPWNIFDDMEE